MPFLWIIILFCAFLVGYLYGQEYTIKYLTPAEIKFPKHNEKTEIKTDTSGAGPVADIKIASYYDYKLDGIAWSKNHRTCASRDYPRKTMLRVTNIANMKSVDCLVNDYGPEAWTNRHIDLSSFAFSQIADLRLGLAEVVIEKL